MNRKKWPAFLIETPRLVLRCFHEDDAAAFRSLLDRNDSHLRPWIPWMKHEPMSLPDTTHRLGKFRRNFELDKEFRYAILKRENARMIGLAGLHTRQGEGILEIGYLVDRLEAGKGYAMETTRALMRAAFELHGITRVEIHCAPENLASTEIPRKLGFMHEKTLEKSSEDSQGVLRDSMLWSMNRERYAELDTNLVIDAYDAAGKRIAWSG